MKTGKSILWGVLFSCTACLFGMVSCDSQPDEQKTQAALEKKGGQVITIEVNEPEAAEMISAILQARLDRAGAKKAFVKVSGENRIVAMIPDVKEPERVRYLLQSSGRLEFWETYENSEIMPMLIQINRQLPQLPEVEIESDDEREIQIAEYKRANPLFGILNPSISADGTPFRGPVPGNVYYADTARVMAMLTSPTAKAILPLDLRLKWTAKQSCFGESYYSLIALKAQRDGRAALGGEVITDAQATRNKWSPEPVVDLAMSEEGARVWQRVTMENIGKSIAIVLDDNVYSYPTVMCEITGGRSQITGNFTEEEAKDLANILKSGPLPCSVRIIEEQTIEPK